MTPNAPRFSRWLLERSASAHGNPFIVADLSEAFVMRARKNPRAARRWYRRQALLSSLILLRMRFLPVVENQSSVPRTRKAGYAMLLQSFLYDFRHGVRALRQHPLFALAALATLTVGIGGVVALFSVMRAVLLEPPIYDAPELVVNLYEIREGDSERRSNMSYPDVMDVRAQATTLSVVAARQSWEPTLLGDGEPARLDGSSVSANYFGVYGIQPVLGRLFDESDGVPGHTPVVVISHAMWTERFGGRPDIIGATLDLSGTSYEVVGVVPPGFEDTEGQEVIWRADPPHFDATQLSRTGHSYRPAARVAPGFTLSDVNAELRQINADLVRQYPEKTGDDMLAVPVMDVLVGQSRTTILLLFAAVSLLLVISCVNVANLLLSRASARRREMAVRTALGAAPRRLKAQLLTESLVLAAFGGGAGVLLAYAVVPMFVQMSSAIPRAERISVDLSVLVFALALTLIVGVAFGLAPVWLVRKGSPSYQLRDGQRTLDAASGWTLRNVLVVAELALSVVLLTGAGLLIRSFLNMQRVDKGVRTDHVLTMNVTPSDDRWPGHGNLTRYWEEVVTRVNVVPGVRTSGAVSFLPMSGGYEGQGIRRMDRPEPEPGQQFGAEARAVTADYFEAIGINVVRGRGFTAADDSSSVPVIAINQTLANGLFPGENPLGRYIEVQLEEPHEIVGVVSDAHQFGVQAPVLPEVYAPHAQPFVSWIRRSMDLVVHTDVEPEAIASTVRAAVWSVDPAAPITNMKTMERWVSEDVSAPRFRTILLSAFSFAALLLTVVGISGVLSYAVARRTAEFGLRAALGASRADVTHMILGQGGTLVALGGSIGIGVAIIGGRVVESLLFQVESVDLLTLVSVAVGVALVSFVAMLIPAIRAGRISPMVAMRE